MPTIITADQLRQALGGISSSLYDDNYLGQIIDTAEEVILPMLETPVGDYTEDPAVQSAVYVIATEIFQSRTAAGGQIEGVDFSPSPFRMGKSLWNRVSGLLSGLIDVDSIAQ